MNNQKKNRGLKVAIIVIAIIILILISTFCCMYFLTDIFKSNKEVFFKYAAQLVQQEKGFLDENLIQYFEKKKSNPYENTSTINFDISIPEMGQDNKLLDDFNMNFSGKVDNANSKNEQNISLNYSNDVKFPFYYRKVGDATGIQTDRIGSKYIAIRNGEELQEVDQYIKGLEEIGGLLNIQISNEDIQNVKNTYFDNIFSKIQEDKFSKISEENKTGYKLSLTGDELKEILIQILETLKIDENMMNKLNETLSLEQTSTKITTSKINDMVEELNNSQLGNIDITIYETNGKISGLVLKQEKVEIILEKTKNDTQLKYDISIKIYQNSETELGLNLIASYSGINSNNVSENYEILIEGTNNNSNIENIEEDNNKTNLQNTKSSYKYTINNIVQFTDNINIEEFKTENAIILNDQEEQYVSNLIGAIKQRLENVNQSQMEKLGATAEQNPITYILPDTLLSTFLGKSNEVSEVEVTGFNNKFYLYQGTSQKGVTVKGLLSTIALNNGYEISDISSSGIEDNDNPKIIEIHFDGEEYEASEQNITLIKSMVETETLYRVEFELDANTGMIYRVVINKQ